MTVGTCSASGALFAIVFVLLVATVTIVRCKRMRSYPDEHDKGNINAIRQTERYKMCEA